ncbi:MAG TPA: Plug domain-containing protein, partial [Flavobacteriales bacterium]|nr:Plug domain-containing protein [Flavobacteriales bacterium]
MQERVPVYTVTSSDLESELGSQDISGILQSSRDVFASTAGLSWGPARFRIRGLDGENTSVLINGILVNDPEAGWATWSQWGGLNDVTRSMEIRTGLSASRLVFAGIGGYSAINARASDQRRGTRISYALSNRAYDHRVMLTHSTGMMKNGWAVSASASWRYANEG